MGARIRMGSAMGHGKRIKPSVVLPASKPVRPAGRDFSGGFNGPAPQIRDSSLTGSKLRAAEAAWGRPVAKSIWPHMVGPARVKMLGSEFGVGSKTPPRQLAQGGGVPFLDRAKRFNRKYPTTSGFIGGLVAIDAIRGYKVRGT